jgi:hypothetical protein
MTDFLELADQIVARSQRLVMSDAFRVIISPKEREMIVAALRGADALRALADLPPRTTGVVGGSCK